MDGWSVVTGVMAETHGMWHGDFLPSLGLVTTN